MGRRRAVSSMTAHRCGGCSRCSSCCQAHPQRDRLLDCGFWDAVHQPGHRPGVVRGLQQPGDELHVVAADDARRLLKAEVGLEPRGQHVAVGVPPARRVGLPGQGEQVLPFGAVTDPVEAEQVRHVALLEAGPAQLEPADLGPRRPDRVPGAVPGDPRGLAEPAQPRAEEQANHRRADLAVVNDARFLRSWRAPRRVQCPRSRCESGAAPPILVWPGPLRLAE